MVCGSLNNRKHLLISLKDNFSIHFHLRVVFYCSYVRIINMAVGHWCIIASLRQVNCRIIPNFFFSFKQWTLKYIFLSHKEYNMRIRQTINSKVWRAENKNLIWMSVLFYFVNSPVNGPLVPTRNNYQYYDDTLLEKAEEENHR